MSEGKHTPGPWEAGYGRGLTGPTAALTVPLNQPYEIVSKPGDAGDGLFGSVIAILPAYGRDEVKANAHLIAAAPDLLTALKFVWPALRRCGYRDDSVEIRTIEAAIAQAEPPADKGAN